jgi:hypothetical protein
MALSTMLGQFLGVAPNIAQTVYLTPRSTIARLDVLTNVAAIVLPAKSDALRSVQGLIKRAKKVLGKRHVLVHTAWGQAKEPGHVQRIHLPMTEKPGSTPVPIMEIETLATDTGLLILEIMALAQTLPSAKPWPFPRIHVGSDPPGKR